MNTSDTSTSGTQAQVVGLGLFTEQPCVCSITPDQAGRQAGLRFLTPSGEIPVSLDRRTDTPIHPAFASMGARSTNLALPGSTKPVVITVEHVLSVCAGLGIWNALITLSAPEVPIDDGSANAFVTLLDGFPATNAQPILITEPITVSAGDGQITAHPVPADQPASYTYHLDYGPSAPIPAQSASWRVGDATDYARLIAPARTFSLLAEARAMQAAGLFKAFTPTDLLVIGEDGSPIDNAWRFENEPARHKLLDLIGDLALLGRPLHAKVTATRSGHALNHALAAAVAQSMV